MHCALSRLPAGNFLRPPGCKQPLLVVFCAPLRMQEAPQSQASGWSEDKTARCQLPVSAWQQA